MDLETLTRAIAHQVLERLREERRKTRVLVLAERDDAVVTTVHERLGKDADIIFSGEEDGRPPERCILTSLSCSDMVDLADGKASGPRMSEALRLLLSGVRLDVLEFVYKTYADSAPAALYARYESCERTLASYGVAELKAKSPEVVRLRSDLVTERDVRAALRDGASTLLVPAATLVTPLAQDAAREAHLTILKKT